MKGKFTVWFNGKKIHEAENPITDVGINKVIDVNFREIKAKNMVTVDATKIDYIELQLEHKKND